MQSNVEAFVDGNGQNFERREQSRQRPFWYHWKILVVNLIAGTSILAVISVGVGVGVGFGYGVGRSHSHSHSYSHSHECSRSCGRCHDDRKGILHEVEERVRWFLDPFRDRGILLYDGIVESAAAAVAAAISTGGCQSGGSRADQFFVSVVVSVVPSVLRFGFSLRLGGGDGGGGTVFHTDHYVDARVLAVGSIDQFPVVGPQRVLSAFSSLGRRLGRRRRRENDAILARLGLEGTLSVHDFCDVVVFQAFGSNLLFLLVGSSSSSFAAGGDKCGG
mmetsp:Transcript_16843/g.46236  ORF Transcript_16843/g.46236 Transcript_16843/m.46236 type:complete len:276 (+) Transcript_16843:4165-4992(+)